VGRVVEGRDVILKNTGEKVEDKGWEVII